MHEERVSICPAGLRVMLVQSNLPEAQRLSSTLRRWDIDVRIARDSPEALRVASNCLPDLSLIDCSLNGPTDGLEVAAAVRGQHPRMGIIILATVGIMSIRVRALMESADDYIVKPIGAQELVARLVSLARRCRSSAPETTRTIAHAGIEVDLVRREVWIEGRAVKLQTRQYDILVLLLMHRGRLVGADELFSALWKSHHIKETSVIRVQISLLRKALGRAAAHIQTGKGGRWGIDAAP